MSFKKILFNLFFVLITVSVKAGIIVTNGLTHVHKIEEGKVYQGTIVIENTSGQAQDVKLYQKDYSYNANGNSFYEDHGTNERSNLKWTHLKSDLVRIEGHAKTALSYEIRVPEGILPGSFWSVIFVEPVDEINTNQPAAAALQIKTVMRYAIQIITTTTKPAQAALFFDKIEVANQENKNILNIDIKNTGDLFARVDTSVEIFNQQTGESLGKYTSSKEGLLPSNSKKFSIDISNVPAGVYSASLLASSDTDDVFGIQIELHVPNK